MAASLSPRHTIMVIQLVALPAGCKETSPHRQPPQARPESHEPLWPPTSSPGRRQWMPEGPELTGTQKPLVLRNPSWPGPLI